MLDEPRPERFEMSDAAPSSPALEAAVESDAEFFAKAGPLPTAWDEARRFPRFYYRAKVQATIHPFRGAPQPAVECTVLTRDLSRGGLNLIHTEQLYPGQRIELLLLDGVKRVVEVCWCRRLANRCYSVGCRFGKQASPAAPAPGSPGEA
jgi:hypothetical protein